MSTLSHAINKVRHVRSNFWMSVKWLSYAWKIEKSVFRTTVQYTVYDGSWRIWNFKVSSNTNTDVSTDVLHHT